MYFSTDVRQASLKGATPIASICDLCVMPELLLGLDLGGQTVAVPPEAALDAAALHRLVAGDDVLDVAGEQVAVVRQAVGEGRAVVEDELVAADLTARTVGGARLDAGDEGAVGVPVAPDPLLDLGESRGRRAPRGRPGGRLPSRPWGSSLQVSSSSARSPDRTHRVRQVLCEDDDARRRARPDLGGRHRGTTSLADPSGEGRDRSLSRL